MSHIHHNSAWFGSWLTTALVALMESFISGWHSVRTICMFVCLVFAWVNWRLADGVSGQFDGRSGNGYQPLPHLGRAKPPPRDPNGVEGDGK